MNLTWHIFKKDFRRLRLPALAWLLLLAAQVIVSERLLSVRSADLNWFLLTGTLFNLLEAVGLVVSYILVAFLVLDDPLVGTEMFWVTRPISGACLLGAKLIAIGLMLGFVPVLVWLPWWLYCGWGWGDIVHSTLRVLCVQTIAVAPALVIATLTNQIARFLLYSLLLLMLAWVGLLNLLTHWQEFPASLVETRLWMAAGLFLVCGAVVIGKQFLTRRLPPSVAILACGGTLAAAAAFWWPWDLTRIWQSDQKPMSGTERVSARIVQASFEAAKGNLVVECLLMGLPEDSISASGIADVELRWPDGTRFRQDHLKLSVRLGENKSLQHALMLQPVEEDSETNKHREEMAREFKRRALEIDWWKRRTSRAPGTGFDEAIVSATLVISQPIATRIKAEPPACSVWARITLRRPELLLELPLREDVQQSGKGMRMHVVQLKPEKRKPTKYGMVGKSLTVTVVYEQAPDVTEMHFFQVDRGDGNAAILSGSSAMSAFPISGKIVGAWMDITPPQLWRTDKWVDRPGWLESTTLSAVAYRESGGFNREIHTDRLVVQEPETGE